MAEDLIIKEKASKKEQYESLIPQIKALIDGEPNRIACMANVCAALKEGMNFFWVGFYMVDSESELILGPFQGPVACTRISKGSGVCGSSWSQNQPIIVPDVDLFPGHIACSSASRSEIVIPVEIDSEVIGVFDVDSDQLNAFDDDDKKYLSEIIGLLP